MKGGSRDVLDTLSEPDRQPQDRVMHDHIPAEEIPISAGGIVLRQGPISSMGDGRMSEQWYWSTLI